VGVRQHVLGAENHLRHPGRVAQVDEDHSAVVAPTGNPSGKGYLLARVGGAQ
jgi:hypothetical protein